MIRVREAVVRYKASGVVSETISNPLGVYEFFSQKVRGETRETFYCLYMDGRNGMVCFELVAIGGSMAAVVDVKSIVRTALLVGAERLILVHNLCGAPHKLCYVDLPVMCSVFNADYGKPAMTA